MSKFLLILLPLVITLGCQVPIADSEDNMALRTSGSGGWSKSIDLISGNVNQNSTMQVDFDEAAEYTVQFTVDNFIDLAGGPGIINPRADITWTVEGNPIRRTVSIANGTSVSGIGQACKVKVYDEPLIGGSGSPWAYTVGITLAPGLRPATQTQPQLNPDLGTPGTLSSILVAAGSSITLPIPQNVGATSIYITATGRNAGAPITLTPANAVVRHINQLAFDDKVYFPVNAGWVPLAASSNQYVLENAFAGGSGNDILFSVTFGIDG
jgi:hypothetical protein